MNRTKVSTAAAIIAHILAWAATLFFLFRPVYSGVSVSPGESSTSGVTGRTLVEVNGLWSALLLVIPVALTAVTLIASLPNPARPRLMLTLRWASFVLLLAFCAVSALSIGIFYLPAAIATLVLAIVGPYRRSQSVDNSGADALPQ
ncbi:MAG: hypothetical protein F4X34_03990 [Chloroflexi bacterium]|nr:hypothetical protein [Chloroflexota bacterium]